MELTIRNLLGDKAGILVQGITGRQGRLETAWMLESGVHIAAGVTPGKGGQSVEGVPVYDTVLEARRDFPALVAMNYAPRRSAPDAAMEAFAAGISLVVMSAENVPLHRLVLAIELARSRGARLIGPNSQGIVVPGVGRVGCPGGRDPGSRFAAGGVAVVSRSGGMTSELAMLVRQWGYGTSVQMALGGAPIVGTSLTEGISLCQRDPETRLVVAFGEPSGAQESDLAAAITKGEVHLPVVALIGGAAADQLPADVPFGHAPRAGFGLERSVSGKVEALRAAGADVVSDTRGVRNALYRHLGEPSRLFADTGMVTS